MAAIRVQTHRFGFVTLQGSFVSVNYNPATQQFRFDSPDYELVFEQVPADIGRKVVTGILNDPVKNETITSLYEFGVLSEEV